MADGDRPTDLDDPTDRGLLTDVAGVAVGHWTDAAARTGCTVVLLPDGSVGSGEIRGGAPATRDVALLDPSKLVDRIDAVVLTGGSAFGLSAADGVMTWLEEAGRGWPTPAGSVPIVPALGLFDLGVGDAAVRPGPAEGRAACEAAATGHHGIGQVGAGTGCTVDTWLGHDRLRPGGLVAASERLGDVVVAALVAVNAFGSVGVASQEALDRVRSGAAAVEPPPAVGNTTIGVVITNLRLDKTGCHLLAKAAHHGLARAVFPSHTRSDGDGFVAVSTGSVDPGAEAPSGPDAERRSSRDGIDLDLLCIVATATVERAVLSLGSSPL